MKKIIRQNSVADPGFPVGGGMDLVGGAVDPRGGYVSKILHVKMKESGPVGGARAGRPLDPPMKLYSFCHNRNLEFPIQETMVAIVIILPIVYQFRTMEIRAELLKKANAACCPRTENNLF